MNATDDIGEDEVFRHLYVHVPFCPRVCPYCSFYVQPADRRSIGPLFDALIQELEWRKGVHTLKLATVYLGGGTPSALATEQLERLVGKILGACSSAPEEFTIEVNPTTVSPEKARMLRSMGVNRVSLGAQSFDPGILSLLGRQHSPDKIRRSYAILREAGFQNINMDLIYRVPGMSCQKWEETLAQAVALGPEHISPYSLTIEEGTPFHERYERGEMILSGADDEWMFRHTHTFLAAAGLPSYEVSNFAKPGFESAHNRSYWNGSNFLGIGPSAVSSLGERRWKNRANNLEYIEGLQSGSPKYDFMEVLEVRVRNKEKMIFGLRTRDGVEAGGDISVFLDLAREGYAEPVGNRWRLTLEGLIRADSIAELFI